MIENTSKTKHPAAQVAYAKKAAALKAANAAKAAKKGRPQLEHQALARPLYIETLSQPERLGAAHRSQGPPHLISKTEVLAIVGVSYVTIWSMMRAGTFPRSRIVGGKSCWLSTEVDAWLANLPVRRLKGDATDVVAA